MIIPRHTFFGDALVFDCRFQHHVFVELGHHGALDFLPGGLVIGVFVAALRRQVGAAFFQFLTEDQNVGGTFTQVDVSDWDRWSGPPSAA